MHVHEAKNCDNHFPILEMPCELFIYWKSVQTIVCLAYCKLNDIPEKSITYLHKVLSMILHNSVISLICTFITGTFLNNWKVFWRNKLYQKVGNSLVCRCDMNIDSMDTVNKYYSLHSYVCLWFKIHRN